MTHKPDEQAFLTNETFWDDFWGEITLPARIEPDVQWYMALAEAFHTYLPPGNDTLRLLEIGCAPGRWLVWFRQAMHYQVAGCDSSPHGISLTRENVRLNGIEVELYQGDMFSNIVPEQAFDVVVSIGLIEHFTETEPVIRRHLEFVKPGGYLALNVPNMAGKLNLFLLRMARMQRFLSVHNLEVMNRTFFEKIARTYGLETVFLNYIGGFDPGLITYNVVHDHPSPKAFDALSPHSRRLQKLWYLLWKKKLFVLPPLKLIERLFRKHPYPFTKFNNPCCSHMLLGVFRKPA
jgi:2-polyprenyl-3-methyl-5-hydroxy-6-metoxy-1,4-benzoquinol methylase